MCAVGGNNANRATKNGHCQRTRCQSGRPYFSHLSKEGKIQPPSRCCCQLGGLAAPDAVVIRRSVFSCQADGTIKWVICQLAAKVRGRFPDLLPGAPNGKVTTVWAVGDPGLGRPISIHEIHGVKPITIGGKGQLAAIGRPNGN